MATVKKPAATKTAAKAKPAAKKPAVKAKPAVKKPAAKKPAAKPIARAKPAAKKPAAKKVVKPAPAKAAPVKKAVKPVIKKTVLVEEGLDSNVKYRNLFDAFTQNKLPFSRGYIISSFFDDKTAYSIYEIVSYAGVKEIFPTEDGLQFITGGKKLYILVENDTYYQKPVEPVSRTQGESIPKRFSELETIIAKNQTKIYVAKEPNELYGSFTILKPSSLNFSVVFYELPDMYQSITQFFLDSLNRQRRVPEMDAKKAAKLISSTLEKTMGFRGDFI